MDQQKLQFIAAGAVPLLRTLDARVRAQWGKMNAQQMVEHLADFFRVSTGKVRIPLVTPQEQLPRFKAFLLSDKQFRENTVAPMLPDTPAEVRYAGLQEAVDQLAFEIKEFVERFTGEPGLVSQHPVFGDLNFEEWVLLHDKHLRHHLRQFGLF